MSSFAFFRLFSADSRLDIVSTGVDSYRSEQLVQAIQHGDGNGVRQLLQFYGESGRRQNLETDERGNTILHLAVDANKADIVSLILAHQPHLRTLQNVVGITPLHNAAQLGYCDIIEILLSSPHGSTSESAETTVESAHCSHSHDGASEGASKSERPAHGGVALPGLTHMTSLDPLDLRGFSPLFCAVERGNVDAVVQLLKKGANIRSRSVMQETVFHVAAVHNRIEETKVLLQHIKNEIATASAAPPSAASVSTDAGSDDVPQVIERFLRSIVSEGDSSGLTALHVAAKLSRNEIASLLLEFGANVNAKDVNLRTPLRVAVFEANYNLVSLLLQYGADPLTVDKFGLSPFNCLPPSKTSSNVTELLLARIVPTDTQLSLIRAKPGVVGRQMLQEKYLIAGILPSLKELCRASIRDRLGNHRLHLIHSFGLPRACEQFLFYDLPVMPNETGVRVLDAIYPQVVGASGDDSSSQEEDEEVEV